jgi:hypothetical protein
MFFDNKLLEDVQRKIAAKLTALDDPPRRVLRAQGAHENTAEPYRDSLDNILLRAGFTLNGAQQYGLAQADEMLRRLFGADVQLRMAAKTRLATLHLLREGDAVASGPAASSHLLTRMVNKALPPQTSSRLTLLVNSKMPGKAVLPMTFNVQRG